MDGCITSRRSWIKVMLLVLVLGSTLAAQPVQWTVQSGGNGHWYELVPNSWVTWDQARAVAKARQHNGRPGDLATITSPQEQAFAETLITTAAWTGWLGGYQEPPGNPIESNWHWIAQWEGTPYAQAAESWNYTHWLNGEPNLAFEDGLSIYLNHGNPPGGWNNAARDGTNSYEYSALVEYVPEPASLFLVALGGIAVLKRR